MSSAIQTCQPPRRSRAASTKSWLMISPPSGARPGQQRQAAQLGEGRHADDRVVAPVIALAQRPVADARRPTAARRARPRTAACGRTRVWPRTSLGGAWISPTAGLASMRSTSRIIARPGHQAVGVEHDHVAVGAAPAGDEVLDVAGLALHVAQAAPVVDPLRTRARPGAAAARRRARPARCRDRSCR